MARFFLFCLLLTLPLQAADLISVRVGQHAKKTRLVLDLTGPVTRKGMRFKDVTARPKLLGLHLGKGLLHAYTLTQETDTTLKIQLTLKNSATVDRVFGLRNPNRIVIDIVPKKGNTSARKALLVTPTQKPELIEAQAVFPQPVTHKPVRAITPLLNLPIPHHKPHFPTVIIDPGHGGKDPGTVGKGRFLEKNIVLSVAKHIQQICEERGYPFNIILTRTQDKFLPLRKRFAFARRKDADLFISLHADSHKNKSLNGISIYTLSDKASDSEAALLARKENKADLIGGADLKHVSGEISNILISLSQQETQTRSEQVAQYLVNSFPKKMWASSRPHRSAGFAVLKAPDVPSILIELGYLSSQKDLKRLKQKDYQKLLALRIIKAMHQYFKSELYQ